MTTAADRKKADDEAADKAKAALEARKREAAKVALETKTKESKAAEAKARGSAAEPAAASHKAAPGLRSPTTPPGADRHSPEPVPTYPAEPSTDTGAAPPATDSPPDAAYDPYAPDWGPSGPAGLPDGTVDTAGYDDATDRAAGAAEPPVSFDQADV